MDYTNSRIQKLRLYLFDVIRELKTDSKYQINANMLSSDIDNYSLDKVPTSTTIEKWITGIEIHRDVFSFRSRFAYSQDVVNNLKNVDFFEDFEQKIALRNKQGILPEIVGIQSIKCLNSATMINANTNNATFEIQIQIEYQIKYENEISL